VQIQSCYFGYQGILLSTGRKVALLGDDQGYLCLPERERSTIFEGMRAFKQYSFLLLPFFPYFANLVFALYCRKIPNRRSSIVLISDVIPSFNS
jgi:hypothetical protein